MSVERDCLRVARFEFAEHRPEVRGLLQCAVVFLDQEFALAGRISERLDYILWRVAARTRIGRDSDELPASEDPPACQEMTHGAARTSGRPCEGKRKTSGSVSHGPPRPADRPELVTVELRPS